MARCAICGSDGSRWHACWGQPEELKEPTASEEALGKALHVEVTFFQHGNIAKCQCALCNAVKSALIDARKIGSQTKLVLTFVPGEAGWPYE